MLSSREHRLASHRDRLTAARSDFIAPAIRIDLGVSRRASYQTVRNPGQVIGQGYHRSGWPWVFESIFSNSATTGVFLEDFAEQRFSYMSPNEPLLRPWIGIFHHPPDPPPFLKQEEQLVNIFKTELFRQSLPNLLGVITLSKHLADFFQGQFPSLPVLSTKHPFPNEPVWDLNLWRNQSTKNLIQVGYYQRNTQCIFQFPTPSGWVKHRLLQNTRRWWDTVVREQTSFFRRKLFNDAVIEHDYVSNYDYDLLRRSSVFITEAFSASACNGIGDCISSCTPVLCNPLPSFVEYLGADYPGYFSHPNQIPELLQESNVIAMYKHLKTMDRDWMSRSNLIEAIESLILQVAS